MRKIAVLTSGGDAPGMNAALRAVVRTAHFEKIPIYGVGRGFSGLLCGEIQEMGLSSVGGVIHQGGTLLRTARCEEFLQEKYQRQALLALHSRGIEGLIVIGGEGSLKGAQALSRLGLGVVGIPATIDNDLSYTDFSIGFDTALNTVLEAISKLRDTTSSHERITIVEVMGRSCGDIALYAGLAGGAEAVLVPEIPYDLEEIARRLQASYQRGKTQSILVVAEGAADSRQIQKEITQKTGFESRLSVLGYIQRGGSPSAKDRLLATQMGALAVRLLAQGKQGLALGLRCNAIIEVALEDAAEKGSHFDPALYELVTTLSI